VSEIRWLPEALSDIERLYRFLYEKNPEAAARAAATILQGANQLKSIPSAGRPMPDETSRREWFIAFGAGAYVLRYRLDKSVIVIIRVWHSRENR
jgi:plasmid stabilization system protein ParE